MNRTRRAVSILLAVCMLCTLCISMFAADVPTQQEAYTKMIALKTEYPEGMRWTNENYYAWSGGIYTGGYGCAGFAFRLSDAAFGKAPARMVEDVVFSQVRVGDILRVNQNTHSVIVLEVHTNSVMIAEGNYNSSVHWGRTLTKAEVEASDYMLTRYTVTTTPQQPQPEDPQPQQTFSDVHAGAWYYDEVNYVYENQLMNGVGNDRFDPNGSMTRAMLVTVLWRYRGQPQSGTNGFTDVAANTWYTDAVAWAAQNGIVNGIGDGRFDPEGKITREQMATIFYRFAKLEGLDTTASGTLSGFSDASKVSSWAQAALQWATAVGLVSGTKTNGVTLIQPQGNAVRAQVAAVLMRYIENL